MRDLLAEWNGCGPVVEGMADDFAREAGRRVSDATASEHDIRGALVLQGARRMVLDIFVARPVALVE